MGDILHEESFIVPFIKTTERPFGVPIDYFAANNFLHDQWKKYSFGESRLRGDFVYQWPEISVSLIALLRQQGIPVEKIDKEFLDHLEQTKPLKGLLGMSVGGVELEALVPFGLSVVSIDPIFSRYAELPEDHFSGLVQRVPFALTPELIETFHLKDKFDISNTSNVFAFSSGAEDLKTLWDSVISITKPGGITVHLMETPEYRALFDPKRLQEEYLYPNKPKLSFSHQVLGVFRRIT